MRPSCDACRIALVCRLVRLDGFPELGCPSIACSDCNVVDTIPWGTISWRALLETRKARKETILSQRKHSVQKWTVKSEFSSPQRSIGIAPQRHE